MEKIITYETLRRFTYSNDKIVKQPIKGIVLDFQGLNFKDMKGSDDERACIFAEHGIIQLIPYLNPWAWMNMQSVSYVNELVDVLFEEYKLPENTPIVSSGGSMGGQQALVYMVYGKRAPTACVVNCPVCDIPYHYTERPDLPRTMYSAYGTYDMSLKEALEMESPLHLADKLPDADYYFFHCEADLSVNKEMHSDRLVAALSGKRRVTYHTVPEKGHCDLTPRMRVLYNKYIIDSICK